MYGIHTRFASAAISDGLGFDGDIVGWVYKLAANLCKCLYTNVDGGILLCSSVQYM